MKKTIILIAIVILMIVPILSYAKPFAYLVADDEIIKLDTVTDTIVSRQKTTSNDLEGNLSLNDAGCAVDTINKYLITLYKPSRLGSEDQSGFFVYNLQTLNKIKFAPFPAVIKDPAMMGRIIYPQLGPKFYIAIEDATLNNGQGGMINLVYEKKTFNYLGAASNILNKYIERFWFSEDQAKIYVDTIESNIRIYDSQTLQQIGSVDLSNVFNKNVWGKDIEDIKNKIALLAENIKIQNDDKNNIAFLTYNLDDTTITPRVITNMDDNVILLTPDSKKILFNETSPLVFGPKAPRKTASSTGHIYIYDVKTGNRIGFVTLPTDFAEKIHGIRPTGDKLYYEMYSRDSSKIKLYVVDIVNYKILKSISVPDINFMVFFEE
jgi:hypothetical protein